MYLEFLLWRHQLWGYQQRIRRRYSHKNSFSNTNSHIFIRKHEFCCLCFKEIFQRIISSEGILHLPNEVSCLWSLKAPDAEDDSLACNSNMQVLLNYQDPCQNLAASEANDGNAEKMIQLDPSEIEAELLEHAKWDPWDIPLKEMENRVRTGRGSGSSEDAQNKAGSASFWKHWHCLSEAAFSSYYSSLLHTCAQWDGNVKKRSLTKKKCKPY